LQLQHLIVDFIDSLDTTESLPQKPFKCEMCMGFWISLFPFVIQYGTTGFLMAPIVGILSDVIYRLKNRI